MKNDLKSILDNLTTYFDSLFKDRKTKIIILSSICAFIVVGIVSCFAITSNAAEPEPVSDPPIYEGNGEFFINHIRLDYGFVDEWFSEGNNDISYVNGFVFTTDIRNRFDFDMITHGVINNKNSMIFVNRSLDRYYYLYNDSWCEVIFAYDVDTDLLPDELHVSFYDSYTYLLGGVWTSSGGYSVSPGADTMFLEGSLIQENQFSTNEVLFATNYTAYASYERIELGYHDYLPTSDAVTFVGSRLFSYYNTESFIFSVTGLSQNDTIQNRIYYSYLLQKGGCTWTPSVLNTTLIKEGYYMLTENDRSIMGDVFSFVRFTCPLSSDRETLYYGVSFMGPSLSDGHTQSIRYFSSSDTTVDVYLYNFDTGVFVDPYLRYIYVPQDTYIPTYNGDTFLDFYTRVTDEDPFIDYENGFNNGFNEGLSQSFMANFIKGILDALDQLTIFYGFSFLTIIQTVLGFCVLLWILKLIAGG